MDAKRCWSAWQELLCRFSCCFTTKGWRRFFEWVTGLVLNVEEHTITQSLIALDRPNDWKALETFAEVGHWNRLSLERTLAHVLEEAPGRLWYGFHVQAGDDTKVHRNSANVWGTCTFHEYTARCPNRASTVRAHNWVVVGALLQNPEQPAWFLPQAARLYCRRSQLPVSNGVPEPFRTKNELLVELFQEQARTVGGKHLAIFDGAYAVRNVVRPLVLPRTGMPRIDILTRLRRDSRLYELPPRERRAGQRGPLPRWGKPMSPPSQGGRWEECRAWTRAPIERTTEILLVAMSLLRMLQFHLQAQSGDDWWLHPPWNPRKQRPSVLDIERLLRGHAPEFRRFLSAWLGSGVENSV